MIRTSLTAALPLRAALVCLAVLAAGSASAAPASAAPGVGMQMPSAALRIGATPVPQAELLQAVAPELKAQGVNLDVKIFEDYSLPNIAVARGELDANFFQTEPYLWRWRAAHGGPLIVVGRVHVEPMGLYSRKLAGPGALAKIRDGAVVVVPSDPANLGRALFLLQRAQLITLDPAKGLDANIGDITENPHHLRIREESPDKLAGLLGSVDLAAINGNYALEAKLPASSALLRESADSPFPNVVVAREDRATDPRVVALVAALRGPTARKFMQDKYGGAVVPAQ